MLFQAQGTHSSVERPPCLHPEVGQFRLRVYQASETVLIRSPQYRPGHIMLACGTVTLLWSNHLERGLKRTLLWASTNPQALRR
jgi:hypothetical protein